MKSWSLPAPVPPQGSVWWPGQRDKAHALAHMLTHRVSQKHRTCQRAANLHKSSNQVSPTSHSHASCTFRMFAQMKDCLFTQAFSLLQFTFDDLTIWQYECLRHVSWSDPAVHLRFYLSSCFGCWGPWLWAISQCSPVSGIIFSPQLKPFIFIFI